MAKNKLMMPQTTFKPKTDDEMIMFLTAQGYGNVRKVEGGFIGLTRLIYTTGLCIDLDAWGYEERYCYGDRFLAERACNAMKRIDDEPMTGYVAKRTR
jgi:hypothetical protein